MLIALSLSPFFYIYLLFIWLQQDLSLWHVGSSLHCLGLSLVVAHGLSCLVPCGILVPWLRIEPVQILNHWTTSPNLKPFLNSYKLCLTFLLDVRELWGSTWDMRSPDSGLSTGGLWAVENSTGSPDAMKRASGRQRHLEKTKIKDRHMIRLSCWLSEEGEKAGPGGR